MQLTPHFSLEELTATAHRGIDNTPTPQARMRLQHTAEGLELIRAKVLGGQSIHVNSGYRSDALNEAVGGVKHSAHRDGDAGDWICPTFGTPYEICVAIVKHNHENPADQIEFDQLIQEGTWVHTSFAPANRRQVLTKSGSGYKPGL